jgi:cytochrome P450
MSAAPNLMDAALIADPYGGYGRLREEAPVLRGVAMDGSPAWYVTRQDDVRDLLADHRFVTNPATAGAADPRATLLGSLGIPREYVISGLVAEHEDGDRLTDTEIVTMILTLVLAGHETTAHLISNGTLALLRHPDQLDLLRRDPSLWPRAVHELMRFCGPVHITRLRYATEDVELGGVTIHAGDAVQAVLVSANFDPRAYADPERLDVTRHPSQRGDGHVGFGHCAHYCLGAALARQEGEVALRALVERFPGLALDGAEPEWVPMPGSHRLKSLPVRLSYMPGAPAGRARQ